MSLSLYSGPFKLDTGGNGDLQYYDQICAVSEAAINIGFTKLFQNQPLAARTINWSNRNVFEGQLEATMLPPQIEFDIESGDSLNFMLKLRFDTGRVFLGGNTYQTIDGWVIAFTPLSFLTCLNATTGDLAAAAKTEDTEQNVVFRSSNPTKLCPGEYSIHRIFAAIADLNWGTIIWNRSYITQANGQKLSLEDWAKNSANNALYSQVQQCLREWTLENNLASCFTQTMILKVPNAKVSPEKVTFAANKLQLKYYPYIDEASQIVSSTRQDMKGTNGSSYNCLCFCEVVGTRKDLPGTLSLPFSGNLAGPGKSAGPAYFGTLVLDHRLFPGGNKLLSQLKELCLSMQTLPSDLDATTGGTDIKSGRKMSLIGGRWRENTYHQTSTQLLRAAEKRPPGMSTMSKIIIEAGPQMTAFKVSGEYGYGPQTEDFSIGNKISSWSFTITITGCQDTSGNSAVCNNPNASFTGCSTEKDPLTGFELLIPDDFTAVIAGESDNWPYILLQKAIRTNVGRLLANIAKDFAPFQGVGKFIYPGNGELKFGPTMLNEDLNMFATIDFLPNGSRVSWPHQDEATNTENNATGTYISDTSVTTDTPHLTWTCLVNVYDPLSHSLDFTLTAVNNSANQLGFKSVTPMFLKMQGLDGKTLFQAGGTWVSTAVSSGTSTATWTLEKSKITTTLDLNIGSFDNGLQFSIFPKVMDKAPDGSNLPNKFLMPDKGSITLRLSGVINTKDDAGVYVVQLNEVWTGATQAQQVRGRADTFLLLELTAEHRFLTSFVTQAVADQRRGVHHD